MKKAIVFGIGNYYIVKREWISQNYEVVGFIDNSVKKGQHRTLDGKTVLNPMEGVLRWETVIILASVNFIDMYAQLEEMGLSEKAVFLINKQPAYDLFEEYMQKNGYEVSADETSMIIHCGKNTLRVKGKLEWQENIRRLYERDFPEIGIIKSLPINPVSRRYGREHGIPIDRYYIEKFLNSNRSVINGVVGEFGDNTYTLQFGKEVSRSVVLHVNGWGENTIKVNLSTGEGIKEGILDTLICTQTIQFIFDLPIVMKNIVRMLNSNGTALITAHGVAQISPYDYRNWGEFWRFTDKSLKELVEKTCDGVEVNVYTYGNVKACVALLYGLCIEDMDAKDLEYTDNQYPMVLGMTIRKKG